MESGTRTFYLGRYNCIEQLGSGPLGETYRAKIYGVAGFEKQFAVKRLHPQLSGDEAFVGRFVQAASAFAALEHQRIARVHEVNAQGAHYYLVVDLVRGLDLRRLSELLLQRGEALPADAAMTIVCDIADALAYAHGRTTVLPGGVLHLGLTPSSVMLTYDGEVKLIDVGLMAALVRPGWSDADGLTPTLAYVAPEEWRGDALDGRADVFSLGVLLHELLGGSRVFLSDQPAELRKAIEGGPPPPPPADPRLQQIVTRALQPDRAQRFASMAELRSAVQAILGGRADRARADLSALVRRLALPRERRTGAFAVVVTPPTGDSTPVGSKPPPLPAAAARPWAPPTPKPPAGPPLPASQPHTTLAATGADDQALVPIELVELPGTPTDKAMPIAATDDAETQRRPRADAKEEAPAASTPPPLPADAVAAPPGDASRPATVPAATAPAATAPANGTAKLPAGAAEATWTPPALKPTAPSPAPSFAAPAGETPPPVEPARQAVPGAKLPPRRGAKRAVVGTVALLAGAGVLAVYFGLSGSLGAGTDTSGGANRPATALANVVDAAHQPADMAQLAAAAAPSQPAAAAVPSAAAAAGGAFTVETTPPGATVFVDGVPSGTTPAQLSVPPGRHRLVVAAEHDQLIKREVDVTPGGRLALTLEPAKLPASLAGPAGLKVRCHTQGELRIFVDGVDSGLSCPNDERISVVPGPHKIGLYSPRDDRTHDVEHEVTEGDYSTRVYVRY